LEAGKPPELEEMLGEVEEEGPAVTELRLEEEPEVVERGGAIAAAEVQPRTMRIGGHEVVEELREGEDLSYLRCVRCGLVARLDEVAKLTEAACSTQAEAAGAEAGRDEKMTDERMACEYCGGPAIGAYPIEYVGGSPIYIPLCADCAGKIERMFVVARPNIADRSGKRLIRCRHPMEGVKAVAWFARTWFVKDGRWPCPACEAAFEGLLDAIRHFVERHPDLASRSGREYVAGVGHVWRTWQGYYCPTCGLLCDSARALREHYGSHGGER